MSWHHSERIKLRKILKQAGLHESVKVLNSETMLKPPLEFAFLVSKKNDKNTVVDLDFPAIRAAIKSHTHYDRWKVEVLNAAFGVVRLIHTSERGAK